MHYARILGLMDALKTLSPIAKMHLASQTRRQSKLARERALGSSVDMVRDVDHTVSANGTQV
jgi:hypothetical protein